MLSQTLRSGANVNFTCRLSATYKNSFSNPSEKNHQKEKSISLTNNHHDKRHFDETLHEQDEVFADARYMALQVACVEGLDDVVGIMLKFKADAGLRNDDGLTALHLAAMHGFKECILAIVSKFDYTSQNSEGYNEANFHDLINAKTLMGETPLLFAAQGGFIDTTSILLRAKVTFFCFHLQFHSFCEQSYAKLRKSTTNGE